MNFRGEVMSWITENANWVAAGLFVFFAAFVVAFFLRNHSAKTDEFGPNEKHTEESNIGIKNSRK
jgi:hypothetical protein